MKISKEKIKIVLAALEISEFTWRTARGLASETDKLNRTGMFKTSDFNKIDAIVKLYGTGIVKNG